jgi:hypothetical protein
MKPIMATMPTAEEGTAVMRMAKGTAAVDTQWVVDIPAAVDMSAVAVDTPWVVDTPAAADMLAAVAVDMPAAHHTGSL